MKKTIVIVVFLSVVGKMFGLLRDVLITNYFGFGELTDALYIAIAIVGLAYSIFNTVIRTSFSPMFSLAYARDRVKTFSSLNSVGNFIVIILLLVTSAIYIFPTVFVQIISPGVSEDTKLFAYEFVKPLSIVIFFYGLVSLLNGFLQAIKVYKTSQIAVLLNNVTIIVIFLVFFQYISYIAIVYGYILGAIVQFFFVYFIFKKNTLEFKWKLTKLERKPILEFSSISKYLLLGAFVSQLTAIADKFVASFLNTGSITALQYATTIKNLPITIVIMVVTNVLFTNLSINHSTSKERFMLNIEKQIDILLAFITPIIIFIIYQSENIVTFLFLRGEFTEEGVRMTANALVAYSFGLFFVIIKEVLNKAALAAKKTKVTFIIAIYSLIFNLVFNVIFSYFWGYIGVAASTSVSALLNTCILIVFLRKTIVLTNFNFIYKIIFKHLVIFITSLTILKYVLLSTSSLLVNITSNFVIIFIFNIGLFYALQKFRKK